MRVSLIFRRSEPVGIPADYRRRFISLLKSAFIESFPHMYEKGALKPYTFAVIFNRGIRFNDGKSIEGVKSVVFKFSTGREELLGTLLNFAINMKSEGEGIGFGRDAPEFKLADIRLEATPPITGYFSTLSPVVLNDPSKDPKVPKSHFLIPGEGNYEERLFETLRERMRRIVRSEPKFFNLAEFSTREVMVRHYRGYVRGAVGTLKVRADGGTLRFIYDYGLGIRTGQGFGMLKVVG